MFNASFQLPIQIGTELFSEVMQPPTKVDINVDARDVPAGQDPDVLARALVRAQQGRLSQFLQAGRQQALLSAQGNFTLRLLLPGIMAIYNRNDNYETMSLYVVPALAPEVVANALYIDVLTNFFVWPIPGSQQFDDPPPNWIVPGNQQKAFYSFYDPAFSPGDRKPSTPPVMAADQNVSFPDAGAIGDYDYVWTDISSAQAALYDPSQNNGYVKDLWLKDIGGTGFYPMLLAGKQYWEVEIRRLPDGVPSSTSFNLGGTDDGSSYEDPTMRLTPSTYTRKYPTQLNTFLNPVIGVIPQYYIEKFVPPDKAGTYTAAELQSLPQLPPRDTLLFTHKLIGLDPVTNKPRSIGAVRSSVMVGDEVTIGVIPVSVDYSVTTTTSYGPLIWETTTVENIYDNLGRLWGTQAIPSGWQFSSPNLTIGLCSANPVYDLAPGQQPPNPVPYKYWSIGDFSVAKGYVYEVIGTNNVQWANVITPGPIDSYQPVSGPPPQFLQPGAPGQRWPSGTGPYWRCVGTIGGPWYGPAYDWVVTGPYFDLNISQFPIRGPVSETRSGSPVPGTQLVEARSGGSFTDTFPNQLFGDFLRQPSWNIEAGQSRPPRKVAVPYDADPGYITPVIKGRGDFFNEFRNQLKEDSNFDPQNDYNYAYDTGVDLGELQVGDRVMIATDAATGRIWFGKNKEWYGPDGGPADPARNIGWAALMDREKDPNTGKLKPAAYYAACSYRYGPTWMRMWLGTGLKYKPPAGFDLLGLTRVKK